MRRLKDKSLGPPDNFRYTDPDTGTKIQAVDYWTFIDRIVEHRKANNLAIPYNIEQLAQDQLCATIPPEYCTYEKEDSLAFRWTSVRLGIHDVVTVTRALLDAALGNYVEPEEAERRAGICSRCYLNVPITGCGACHQLGELIAKGRSTSYDSLLHSCAVCGCVNKTQIHIKLDSMPSHSITDRQNQYPSFCWQKENGPNYKS